MTGVVLGFGACFTCGKPFSFNPHKVPSHRHNGVREPICLACMELMNARRAEVGMEPFPILPDAYSALPEDEL